VGSKSSNFHDLVDSNQIAKPEPVDIYVEVDARPYAELRNDLIKPRGIKRKIKAIFNQDQAKRNRMNSMLGSWGEWARSGKGIEYSGSGIYLGENDDDYEGYDHSLLSDFDSLMIQVEMAVYSLQRIDGYLIELEYSLLYKGRAQMWAVKYGRTQSRYRSRKSELLLKLYNIINH
jgi:hypothetical protein